MLHLVHMFFQSTLVVRQAIQFYMSVLCVTNSHQYIEISTRSKQTKVIFNWWIPYLRNGGVFFFWCYDSLPFFGSIPQGDTHVLEHQSPAISTCFSTCLKFLDILGESTWELHQLLQVPTNTFLVGGKAKNNSESFWDLSNPAGHLQTQALNVRYMNQKPHGGKTGLT